MKRNAKHFTTWENKNVSLISKTLALSKIIHLALVTNVPTVTIELLRKVQKELLWQKNKCRIKHVTLCNDYENGRLRSVDILSKIVSLKYSWKVI